MRSQGLREAQSHMVLVLGVVPSTILLPVLVVLLLASAIKVCGTHDLGGMTWVTK